MRSSKPSAWVPQRTCVGCGWAPPAVQFFKATAMAGQSQRSPSIMAFGTLVDLPSNTVKCLVNLPVRQGRVTCWDKLINDEDCAAKPVASSGQTKRRSSLRPLKNSASSQLAGADYRPSAPQARTRGLPASATLQLANHALIHDNRTLTYSSFWYRPWGRVGLTSGPFR